MYPELSFPVLRYDARLEPSGFPKPAHSLVYQPILPLWFARGGRRQTIHLKSIKDVLCSCGGWLIGEPARWECPFKLLPAPLALVLVDQPEKS